MGYAWESLSPRKRGIKNLRSKMLIRVLRRVTGRYPWYGRLKFKMALGKHFRITSSFMMSRRESFRGIYGF